MSTTFEQRDHPVPGRLAAGGTPPGMDVGDQVRASSDAVARTATGTPGSAMGRGAARQLAHDLNHLMNVVGSLAHLLDAQADDPARVRHHAMRLAQAAERGARLAGAMSDLARAATAGGEPRSASLFADIPLPAGDDATDRPRAVERAHRVDRASLDAEPRATAVSTTHDTPPHVTPARPDAPLRVLVVENDLAGRDLMQALLTGAGYEVTLAAGLEDALGKLDAVAGRLDALVADAGLDDGSGWDLVCRARERWPGMRIGVVTGWPHPPDQEASALVDFVLGKPYRLDELLAELESR